MIHDGLNAMLADLNDLDGAIKVLAPEKSLEPLPIKRKVKDQAFQRNEPTRRIVDMLRRADYPMPSREIAEILAEAKGLSVDRRSLKPLVGRVINALKRQEQVLKCERRTDEALESTAVIKKIPGPGRTRSGGASWTVPIWKSNPSGNVMTLIHL